MSYTDPLNAYYNKPIINKFITEFKEMCKENGLPHYSKFPDLIYENIEVSNNIMTLSIKFIEIYIDTNLSELDEKKKLVKEYTLSRWLNLINNLE